VKPRKPLKRTPLKRSRKPIPSRSKSPAARERARKDRAWQQELAGGNRLVTVAGWLVLWPLVVGMHAWAWAVGDKKEATNRAARL